MRHAVVAIVPLVGEEHAGGLAGAQPVGEAAADMLVVVGVLEGLGRHFDQRRPGQPQRLLLLGALGFRDDDDRAIAARRRHQRQADAGIARRGFDDQAAGLEVAALFGGEDHLAGRAVLDRLARVHELGLAVDGAAGELGGAGEVDQRRVADGIDDSGIDVHWDSVAVQGSVGRQTIRRMAMLQG